jgi:ribosomal protein L15
MPGGDRTGPRGLGPKTGRSLGYCSGYDSPGYANPSFGRGFGRGWGRGFGRGLRGRGRGFWWRGYRDPYYQPQTPFGVNPQPNKDEEKAYLEDIIESLEEEIKMAKERLQKLSKEKKENS